MITELLKKIMSAVYGRDVRKSIHDAIKQCYEDATGNPESVAAVVKQNDEMKELLENTPYTSAESAGEYELPIHTINDEEISDDSTWSSKKIIDAIYPVGSIYMSVNNTNPEGLIGGTWVEWGAGRVPVGVDESYAGFDAVEKEGGEINHQLTIDEIPSHAHAPKKYEASYISYWGDIAVGIAAKGDGAGGYPVYYSDINGQNYIESKTGNTGGGVFHNNLQPFVTCYMWKRTA